MDHRSRDVAAHCSAVNHSMGGSSMEQAVGGQVTQLDELVKTSIQQLEAAGVSSPRVDVELLAGHVLHLSRSEVQLKALTGLEVSEPSATELAELVNERARRIPVQHLTGRAPFRTLQLRVGPGVFTPRPETEIVVEAALTEIDRCAAAGLSAPRVVDLGTGSGAIAAAIATERPQAEIHAVELSTEDRKSVV